MGTKERRERQKESLRQEILDAARDLFATEGYENVSMRKIAEKIEYSPTTIYLYFKDKTEILSQICEETFGKLIKTQEKILRNDKDPLVCLRKGLRAYVDFGLKYPSQYELTFTKPIAKYLGEEAYAYDGSMGQKAFDFLRTGVAECMEKGKLRKGDIDTTSQALWAGVHGVASLLIGHSEFPFVNKNKLIDHLIDIMIEGLKD